MYLTLVKTKMMKTIYILCLMVSINVAAFAQTITSTVIKPPALLRCNEVPAKLNNIVFGAIPPNAQNQPVVVFVHGWFDNGFAWFMAKNKWYENSYNAGYRTAFFFHSFSDAYEDNGRVIAQMIRETCRHYNTDKVIAVCHSKGGYDMDYALYNENVWDSVQGVITLSTPYWGAPLADLISVPFFRTILEAIPIVGPIFKGKGTYQMQTAYMAGVVRPMIDNHPNNRPEKFHCYAAWGYQHATQFPGAIPDDMLKVVFRDYQPLCLDIPGFGNFAGGLMSTFMGITGILTDISNVQPKYENPAKNHHLNDGLAPYYSSLRPGSIEISQRPPSQQSYLNHIDELLSSYAWNIVQPEIEYFKLHPVLRKANQPLATENVPTDISVTAASDMQFIQGNTFSINTASENKLYLVGTCANEKIEVYDEQHRLVKTMPLTLSTQGMLDIFHEIDLSTLASNQKYTIQTSIPVTGLLKDGNSASIEINTHSDKTSYKEEPLDFEVKLNNWPELAATTTVDGFLSRNMDMSGNVLNEKLIPISFVYDETKAVFICKNKLDIPEGVYSVTVFANGNEIKRFAATSILLKQERKAITKTATEWQVFPNPTTDFVTVQYTSDKPSTVVVELFDLTGKLLYQQKQEVELGGHQIQLSNTDLSLPKGAYLLSLSVNGHKNNKVIVFD